MLVAAMMYLVHPMLVEVPLKQFDTLQRRCVSGGQLRCRARYCALARNGQIVANGVPVLHLRIINTGCARLWNGCDERLLAP
jgi:hypothetical protein